MEKDRDGHKGPGTSEVRNPGRAGNEEVEFAVPSRAERVGGHDNQSAETGCTQQIPGCQSRHVAGRRSSRLCYRIFGRHKKVQPLLGARTARAASLESPALVDGVIFPWFFGVASLGSGGVGGVEVVGFVVGWGGHPEVPVAPAGVVVPAGVERERPQIELLNRKRWTTRIEPGSTTGLLDRPLERLDHRIVVCTTDGAYRRGDADDLDLLAERTGSELSAAGGAGQEIVSSAPATSPDAKRVEQQGRRLR